MTPQENSQTNEEIISKVKEVSSELLPILLKLETDEIKVLQKYMDNYAAQLSSSQKALGVAREALEWSRNMTYEYLKTLSYTDEKIAMMPVMISIERALNDIKKVVG